MAGGGEVAVGMPLAEEAATSSSPKRTVDANSPGVAPPQAIFGRRRPATTIGTQLSLKAESEAGDSREKTNRLCSPFPNESFEYTEDIWIEQACTVQRR